MEQSNEKPKTKQQQPINFEKAISILQKPPQYRTQEEIYMFQELVREIKFFQQFDDINEQKLVLYQCAKQMKYEFVRKNNYVFKIDDMGNKFYIILKGKVSIYIRPAKNKNKPKEIPENQIEIQEKNKNITNNNLKNQEQEHIQQILKQPIQQNDQGSQQLFKFIELQKGASFGELALISEKPRAASIFCEEDCYFGILEKHDYKSTIKDIELKRVGKLLKWYKQVNGLNLIKQNSLLRQIQINIIPKTFYSGQYVFQEGQKTQNAFIIKQGVFQIMKKIKIEQTLDQQTPEIVKRKFQKVQFKQVPIMELQEKEIFGEEDFLPFTYTRQYSVVCKSPSGEILILNNDNLQKRILNQEDTLKYFQDKADAFLYRINERVQYVRQNMNKYPHFFWNTTQFDNYLDLHQVLNQALNKLSDTENYLDPSILNNQQQNGEPILKEKSKFQLWEQYPSSIQKRAGKVIYRIDQQEQKRDQFKNSKQDNIELLQNYSEKKIRSMNKIQYQNQQEGSKLYKMNSYTNNYSYSENQSPSKYQNMSKLTPLKQFSLSFYKPSIHQSLNKNSSLSHQMKVQSTQISPFPTDRMSEQNKSNDDSILNIQCNENKNNQFSISPNKNKIKKERNSIQNSKEKEISVQKTSQNIKNSTIQNSQIDYQKFGNLSIEQIQKGFDFVHINNTLKFIKEVDDYRQKIYKQVNSSQQNQESQTISRIKEYKVKQIMRSSEKKKTNQVLTLIPQCADINKSFQQNQIQNQENLQNSIFYNQKHENQPLISQFIPHQNQELNNIDITTNQNSQIIYSNSKSKNYNSTYSRNKTNKMYSKNINKNNIISEQNSINILDKKDLASKSYQNSLNNSQNQFIHQQLQQKYKDSPNRQICQEPKNQKNFQVSDKIQEQKQKNVQSSSKIQNNCQLTNNSIQFEQDPQIHIKDQKKKTQILLTDRDNQSILSQDPEKFMGQVIKPGNPQLQQKFLNSYFNSNNQQQRKQQSKYQSMQFTKQFSAKSTPLTRSTTPQQNFSKNQQKMVILPLPQNINELDPYYTNTQLIPKNENLEIFNMYTNFNQAIKKPRIQSYSSKNLIKYFSRVKNQGTQGQGQKYKFELQQDKCDTKNTQNLKCQGQKQQIENSLFFDESKHKNAKQKNVNNKKHINILQKKWNKNSTILENFPLNTKQSNT